MTADDVRAKLREHRRQPSLVGQGSRRLAGLSLGCPKRTQGAWRSDPERAWPYAGGCLSEDSASPVTELSPRDAEIQRRWLLGESSGVIGKHLHMTRNAVIGIVHRRGWQHYHASPVKLPYPEREAKIARRKPRIMPTERLEQPPRPLGSPRKPIEPLQPLPYLSCL